MKTKKKLKNLSINKETIAHLNNADLSEIIGGDLEPTGITCFYCDSRASCIADPPIYCMSYDTDDYNCG